jgi:hypothetical protein
MIIEKFQMGCSPNDQEKNYVQLTLSCDAALLYINLFIKK